MLKFPDDPDIHAQAQRIARVSPISAAQLSMDLWACSEKLDDATILEWVDRAQKLGYSADSWREVMRRFQVQGAS